MVSQHRSGLGAQRPWRIAVAGAAALAAVTTVAACGSSSKTTNATTTTTTASSSSSSDASSSSSSSGSSGREVSIGGGASLQLAPGWKVDNHKATYVILANSSRTVFYQLSTGPSSGDAVQTLTQDIQTIRTDAAEGQLDFQFIQLQGTPQSDPPPNTQTYDSGADVPFTAKASSSSALSGDVVGEFGELVDSTDGKSVLVIAYAGSTDALDGAHDALKSMNDSLLSS